MLKLGVSACSILWTDWLFSSTMGEASTLRSDISDWTVCDSLVTNSVCSLFDGSDTTRSDSGVSDSDWDTCIVEDSDHVWLGSELLIMELAFCRIV